MSTVVDVSVLVAATVDAGRDGAWAEHILARGTIYGPELLLLEATNIIRRLERAKRITKLEASCAHSDHMRLNAELYPFVPFADRVWELRHTLTSYDAWYMALKHSIYRLPRLIVIFPALKGRAVSFFCSKMND